MIKTFTLAASIFFLALSSHAQFDVGKKLLGGNASFNTGKDDYYNNNSNTSYTNFSLSPTFAKFRKTNVLSGIGFTYNYNRQRTDYLPSSQSTSSTTNSIAINVFTQRFFQLAKGLYFTVQTAGWVSYTFGKQTFYIGTTQENPRTKGCGINLNVAPGISYRLTPRLLLDGYLNNFVSVGYSHSKVSNIAAPNTGQRSNFYLFPVLAIRACQASVSGLDG